MADTRSFGTEESWKGRLFLVGRVINRPAASSYAARATDVCLNIMLPDRVPLLCRLTDDLLNSFCGIMDQSRNVAWDLRAMHCKHIIKLLFASKVWWTFQDGLNAAIKRTWVDWSLTKCAMLVILSLQ